MAYQVLALKWRPAGFEQVVAQDHVTRTLQNAVASGRIANAYLFAGPRGVGKTTTARIFAKALNCKKGPTPTPCNECVNCVEIAAGRSLDVLEIDGASNRGIDEIRNLRENIRYAPNSSKFKIYIVDEVHMLTTEAFNALLKTLEEPPPHVKFIFATTEPHRVPATILSRCQRFDFKRIPIDQIIQQLKLICEHEKIQIDDESLLVIAKKADGSLRDAESLLDQLVSFVGENIQIDQVLDAFSVVSQDLYFEFTDILAEKKVHEGLRFVDRLINSGHDINEFLIGLIEHFRNLLFAKATRDGKLLETSENYKQLYFQKSEAFSEQDLLRFIQIVSDTEYSIRRSPNPRVKLEMTVIKLLKMDRSVTLDEVIEKLNEIGSSEPRTAAPAVPRPAAPVKQTQQRPAEAAPTRKSTGTEAQKKSLIYPNPASSEKKEPSVQEPQVEPHEPEEDKPITLELFRERWQEIVQHVQTRRLYVSVFLKEGEPIRFEKNILEIGFSEENGFQIESLRRNREIIIQAVQEILGCSIGLKFVKAKLERKRKIEVFDSKDAEKPSAPKKIDPMVKRIIDIFDGELITIGG